MSLEPPPFSSEIPQDAVEVPGYDWLFVLKDITKGLGHAINLLTEWLREVSRQKIEVAFLQFWLLWTRDFPEKSEWIFQEWKEPNFHMWEVNGVISGLGEGVVYLPYGGGIDRIGIWNFYWGVRLYQVDSSWHRNKWALYYAAWTQGCLGEDHIFLPDATIPTTFHDITGQKPVHPSVIAAVSSLTPEKNGPIKALLGRLWDSLKPK